ncbi:MAG: hypothetical protein ACK4QL_08875 [Pseudanabaenaceae cyanobacterium]
MTTLVLWSLPTALYGWTEADKSSMSSSCIDSAMRTGWISRSQAQNYCSCLTEATVRRYSAREAASNPSKVISELQQTGVIGSCRRQAGIRGGWTTASRNVMRNSCIDTALKSPGISRRQAESYCGCITEFATRRYTPEQVDANPEGVILELNRSGAIATCRRRAGL